MVSGKGVILSYNPRGAKMDIGDITVSKKQVLETLLIRYKNGYNLSSYEIKFLINESKLANKVADKINGGH